MKTQTQTQTKLSTKDMKLLEDSLKDFHESPWVTYAKSDWTIEELYDQAKNTSVQEALDSVRRADIRAFHAEEASCGNL